MRRGNRDQRLHSYRWQQTTKRILTRDAHRCQWGLDGCTEWADAVDHVYPTAMDGARRPTVLG